MRIVLAFVSAVLVASCVGEPPVPCTKCGTECVDTRVDPNNCGSCGTSCAAGKICSAGSCKDNCPASQKACGGKCVDTTNDPLNCGVCGTNCGSGKLCAGGQCVDSCPPTQEVCGGKCVDKQTDTAHCGACGMACPAGNACTGGACVASCGAPQTACNNACFDTQSSTAHCGSCGMPCGAGQVCAAGVCRAGCNAPLTSCPAGLCVDTTTHPMHCGGCNLACAPLNVTAPLCTAGSCAYLACSPGFTDCDGDPRNGCEAPTSQCLTLVSVALDGGAGNGRSFAPAIDRSGTRVVFFSEASDLVADDTNGVVDLFLRDTVAKRTTRLTTLWDGGEIQGDAGPSYVSADISADGTTVVVSTNMPMINPDTNGLGPDAIVLAADGGRSYGALSSAPGNAQPGGNPNTFGPVFVSEDGNLVTYMTRANNLYVGGMGSLSPGESNVFQYDRAARAMTAPSINFNNQFVTGGGLGFNAFPSWTTHNGRYVAYNSFGFQVVPGVDNGCGHVYLRDQVTATTTRLSVLDNGAMMGCGPQQNAAGGGTVSADGVVVAFSTRVQLPTGTLGPFDNVFTRNPKTGVSSLISIAADGGASNGASFSGQLSGDGKVLAIMSDATNLVPADTNGQRDCFFYELPSKVATRANAPVAVASPDGGAGCAAYRLNAPGSHLALETRDGLVPADQNNGFDVYIRRIK